MTTTLRCILFVEDDPSDARLVLDELAKMNLGGHITVVSDGAAALDFLYARGQFCNRSAGIPAVVLLDLKLPRVSGFEVLKQMRSDPVLKLVPVVVLSASRQERDVRRAYEFGANGYMVKAIDCMASRSSLWAFGEFWAHANEPPPGSLPDKM